MPASKAQQRAVTKYMKENYDEIKIRVEKGRKAIIKNCADNCGESLNQYIISAVDLRMKQDAQGGADHE